MYLTPQDVEATLAVIQARSASRSRLLIAYHSPARILKLVGFVVGRLGEPLRSAFTAEQMRSLLSKHRFVVTEDQDISSFGAKVSPEMERATRMVKHLRVVSAVR